MDNRTCKLGLIWLMVAFMGLWKGKICESNENVFIFFPSKVETLQHWCILWRLHDVEVHKQALKNVLKKEKLKTRTRWLKKRQKIHLDLQRCIYLRPYKEMNTKTKVHSSSHAQIGHRNSNVSSDVFRHLPTTGNL